MSKHEVLSELLQISTLFCVLLSQFLQNKTPFFIPLFTETIDNERR